MPDEPIAYERPAGPTRGQFRLLLLLTLVNTVLLGAAVAGPMLTPFVQGQIAAFQKRRADRAAAEAAAAQARAERETFVATQAEALAYREPPGTLVWGEGVTHANTGEHFRYRSDTSTFVRASPPLYAKLPSPVTAVGSHVDAGGGDKVTVFWSEYAVVYMGERRASADAPPRLIVVNAMRDGTAWGVKLYATALRPATPNEDCVADANAYLVLPGVFAPVGHPSKTFKLYFGQPDPADPARFTLDYEFDGLAGQVVGRLALDGKLTLHATGPLARPAP